MTGFKDNIYILRQHEKLYFLSDEKLINSNLKSYSTLIDLMNYLNTNMHDETEFWLDNEIYHPNNHISLIDLGFNPKFNIIEIKKEECIIDNSPEMNCDRFYRDRKIQKSKAVRFNLYRNDKLFYIWDNLLENIEKIKHDLSESLQFRESLTDNKYEIRTIEQVHNEILELLDGFFEEIKNKLKKIEYAREFND